MLDTTITINGKQCRLEVTQPMGSGGGFHVFVDRYYQGAIVRNHGQWVPMLNDNTVLSPEQAQEVMRVVGGLG